MKYAPYIIIGIAIVVATAAVLWLRKTQRLPTTAAPADNGTSTGNGSTPPPPRQDATEQQSSSRVDSGTMLYIAP